MSLISFSSVWWALELWRRSNMWNKLGKIYRKSTDKPNKRIQCRLARDDRNKPRDNQPWQVVEAQVLIESRGRVGKSKEDIEEGLRFALFWWTVLQLCHSLAAVESACCLVHKCRWRLFPFEQWRKRSCRSCIGALSLHFQSLQGCEHWDWRRAVAIF